MQLWMHWQLKVVLFVVEAKKVLKYQIDGFLAVFY